MRYRIFARKWWKPNKNWPNGKEPRHNAPRSIITETNSEDDARRICKNLNDKRTPNQIKWGYKYEFESVAAR